MSISDEIQKSNERQSEFFRARENEAWVSEPDIDEKELNN